MSGNAIADAFFQSMQVVLLVAILWQLLKCRKG